MNCYYSGSVEVLGRPRVFACLDVFCDGHAKKS